MGMTDEATVMWQFHAARALRDPLYRSGQCATHTAGLSLFEVRRAAGAAEGLGAGVGIAFSTVAEGLEARTALAALAALAPFV